MSDVRNGLAQWFARDIMQTGKSPFEVADAILARFDVVEKPVVTAGELGRMAKRAVLDSRGRPESDCDAGHRMLDQLDAAGLKLVRVDG